MMKASLLVMMEWQEEQVARSTGHGRDSPRLGFPEPKPRSRSWNSPYMLDLSNCRH